jgi:hypothetical protein
VYVNHVALMLLSRGTLLPTDEGLTTKITTCSVEEISLASSRTVIPV